MEATATPNPAMNYPTHQKAPMSVSDWFVTIFITAIPLVGLIMLFVWGFGSDTHPGKANWAKATLLWMLVIFGLYFMLFMVIGLSVLGMDSSY